MTSKKLTQKRLKELLHYDPLSGVFTWKLRWGCRSAGDPAGYTDPLGYVTIRADWILHKAHRLAWLYVYGYFPEHGLDHINRNTSDNRIVNLRCVSQVCNMRNTPNLKSNTSGVKGAIRDNRRGTWYAQIKVNGERCHGGSYKDFEEAVCARLALEQSLNWSGCNSSSPAYQYVQEMLKEGVYMKELNRILGVT